MMKLISELTKEFVRQHRFDDPRQLALKAHKSVEDDLDLKFALAQISGRQTIREKIPSWYENDELIYPLHLSLEQCSSELTACYKALLVSGNSFVDLTGGFGVDCAFISPQFQSVVYVERQEELCEISRCNFDQLGLKSILTVKDDALNYLSSMAEVDCIFLDPARRTNTGRKAVFIADCEPDICLIKDLLMKKGSVVMIKLSPMLDISQALQLLPETYQVHVVGVNNECKELLFLLRKEYDKEPEIISVNLHKDESFSFYRQEEKNTVVEYTREVLEYLYEPNTSILKAGAYKLVASRFNIKKLHRDSHLYTSSGFIPDFPGRIFKVQNVFSFNKKDLKEQLKGMGQANLSIRNFPSTVHDLQKKLYLKDGGKDYLFATTLADGKKVIISGIKI